MCQSHWIDRPADDGDYYDCFRWGFDCFGFFCLGCNNQPFGYVAESLFVVMSTIDQHMMIAAAVVAVVVDGVVVRYFYEVLFSKFND